MTQSSAGQQIEINSFIALLIGGVIVGIVFTFSGIAFYFQQRDEHMKAQGEACIHHVQNLTSSANADLKDIYSITSNENAALTYVWQATAQCLANYPLYSTDNMKNFNLSLR